MPIRDLAAAWDASKALQYLVDINVADDDEVMLIRKHLTDAIMCTLAIYQSNLQKIESGDGVHLREDMLLETSTIGHSALLLLGICDACSLSILNLNEVHDIIDGLVQSILSQQLDNGAFDIEFNSKDTNYLQGVEFYPGEAMLALLSAHDILLSVPTSSATTCQSILQSMEQAFAFYSNYYYTEGDVDINYNIWQVLCFSKYHDTLSIDSNNNRQVKIRLEEVKKYILDMCQEICQSRSWKYQLSRGQSFYQNIETVEIVCGLDALAEGIRINRQEDTENNEDHDKLFKMHAKNALYFIQWTQDQVSNDCIVGKGGLGYGGIQVFEQRLDVTGHAISALVKLHKLAVTIS